MVVVLWLLLVPLLDEAELLLWLASLCGIAEGLCSVVLLLVEGVVADCELLLDCDVADCGSAAGVPVLLLPVVEPVALFAD